MKRIVEWLVAAAMVGGVVTACNPSVAHTDAAPPAGKEAEDKDGTRSARAVRGASPYLEIENEAPPRLIVDDPIPEGLAQGVFWAQYRVENLHIAPVFGKGALSASPRLGHLHVIV